MKHHWRSQRQGGNPADADSYEYVCFCQKCGDELTDENRDAECEGDDRDGPLKTSVEGDWLVIRIGVGTLAWASRSENGGPLTDCEVDIKEVHQFAKDVAKEIMREDGVGNMLICDFLDEMVKKAADNGSGALTVKHNNRKNPNL